MVLCLLGSTAENRRSETCLEAPEAVLRGNLTYRWPVLCGLFCFKPGASHSHLFNNASLHYIHTFVERKCYSCVSYLPSVAIPAAISFRFDLWLARAEFPDTNAFEQLLVLAYKELHKYLAEVLRRRTAPEVSTNATMVGWSKAREAITTTSCQQVARWLFPQSQATPRKKFLFS